MAPKSFLPTYREFYEAPLFARRRGPARARRSRVGGVEVPFGPDLIFCASRRAGPRPARRGLRGHVGADPAQCPRRPGRGHGAGQPLRFPDHHRPGRGPAAAGPLGQLRAAWRRTPMRRQGRASRRPTCPGTGRRWSTSAATCWPRRDASPKVRAARWPTSTSTGSARSGCDRAPSTTTGTPSPSNATLRRGRLHPRPAHRRHRPAPQGRPVPVRPRRRRAARPRLLRGLQHPGLRARAAAARDRAAQGRHRRLRWPRLHARADRRRQGDGPARSASQRHPRVHPARLRHRRDHEVLRHPAVQGARRQLRGARHPPGREADAHRHGPPVRVRRGGLRRHLRERPGRAAHRLPVPDRQPARGNRARHRRPLRAGARAGARTAWATRCRTTRSTPASRRR